MNKEKKKMEEKNMVIFLDNVSRTIGGRLVSEDETTITLGNPVVINAIPNQQGQMSLHLIPVFFREMLDDINQVCEFTYNKENITKSNITSLNNEIERQYEILFQPMTEDVAVVDDSSDTVVEMFDGEEKNNG
jgi:hypothetical protein